MDRKTKRDIANSVHCFNFPFICHPGWKDVPDDLKRDMPMIRLVQLMKEPELFNIESTDEEAMIYISNAASTFPLNHEWTEIMMHLTRKYLLTWRKKAVEDLPDFLHEETKLSEYQTGLLRDLKQWIRKKQYQHAKRK